MVKEISVKADLKGCEMVSLVVPVGENINGLPIEAMQALLNRGIKSVETITPEEASYQMEKAKKIHRGRIPAKRKFLSLTPEGNIKIFR